jgi:hypothetical protein
VSWDEFPRWEEEYPESSEGAAPLPASLAKLVRALPSLGEGDLKDMYEDLLVSAATGSGMPEDVDLDFRALEGAGRRAQRARALQRAATPAGDDNRNLSWG